jgi:hypothetical protein
MPSQRLLKMLDPRGHLPVLASTQPIALVWEPHPAAAAWVAGELRAAGFEPLRATSPRHIAASLAAGARPAVSVVVVDFDDIGQAALAALTSARWGGFTGGIVAISRSPLDARTRAIVGIDACVVPHAPGLRDAVSRRLRQ